MKQAQRTLASRLISCEGRPLRQKWGRPHRPLFRTRNGPYWQRNLNMESANQRVKPYGNLSGNTFAGSIERLNAA